MPPKRLTRSANPTLESLPPKSRGRSTTAAHKARARPDHVLDDETPETTDQSYVEATTHPKGKRVGAKVVQKKRAPIAVASTAPITTYTRGKRVSVGRSIIGASIWEASGAASTASKGVGGEGATGIKRVAVAKQRKKGPISATNETQEVIVVAKGQSRRARELSELSNEEVNNGAESSEDEEPRSPVNKPKTKTTQKGYSKVLPKSKGASKGSTKPPRLGGLRPGDFSAPPASTPRKIASPGGESSEKQHMEKHEMDHVLRAAVTAPSERLSQGSAGQEEGPESGRYGSSDESSSGGGHLGIIDKIKKPCKSYSDYSDPEPEVSEAEEATPGNNNDSPSEGDDDDNLTSFLSRIQEYSAVLSSIHENMRDLISDFDNLKAIQNPPRLSGGFGYVKLLHQITNAIINNRSPRLSAGERFTLQQLDEAMATLSDFYQETRDFEAIFRRLQKSNLTQRSNIDKCQAGIKKTMKVRGYASTSLSTTIVNEETVRRERNKKAARKRIREIEAVVSERERIALGYQTPESVEDQSKRGMGEEEEEEVERLQKRIRVDQDVDQGVDQGVGQDVGQDEEDGYSSLSDEEVLPIVIDEDDVEVVHVEGFGERQKRVRAKEEGREREEGEVEVLEDHEWAEYEIDALLHGIERFQGIFRFEKIMNLYGFGNRAPLKDRSVEAIKEKAIELKKEIIDSGGEEVLGHFWDDI